MEKTNVAMYLPADVAQHLMDEGSQSEIGEEELRERYGLAEAEFTTDGQTGDVAHYVDSNPVLPVRRPDLHGS